MGSSVQHPTGICEVTGPNPVRDSDFFSLSQARDIKKKTLANLDKEMYAKGQKNLLQT